MHSILENNHIHYRNNEVATCFDQLKMFMYKKPDFLPITTMDAGPNIHVLLRDVDLPFFTQFMQAYRLSEVST